MYLNPPRGVPLSSLHNAGKSEPTDIDELDESISNRMLYSPNSLNTRNMPPMADSLEPSKPGSVVNMGYQ